jgi:hypothetical protein
MRGSKAIVKFAFMLGIVVATANWLDGRYLPWSGDRMGAPGVFRRPYVEIDFAALAQVIGVTTVLLVATYAIANVAFRWAASRRRS